MLIETNSYYYAQYALLYYNATKNNDNMSYRKKQLVEKPSKIAAIFRNKSSKNNIDLLV
jgi:hypothetical protein